MFELQLGHLCNNRCVFCVSGQLTSQKLAPLLEGDALVRALEEAWARGFRGVTLLGGEPTIQPGFFAVLGRAVELGFAPIVIFSNGSKPARTDLVERVAAMGGHVEWRFSFQGATKEAHERTTRRKGSFDQLVRSVRRARERGHRVSINMCVVAQNFESLGAFPELLVPLGVEQLHVDMLNPYDTGTLGEDGITAIMPRYTDLVPHLEAMVAGMPRGFDVNVGNLPYCVAPQLAAVVHHGGAPTWTVTASDRGTGELFEGRKKYLVKSTFKTKPASCERCVLADRCSGVFDAYLERFGASELVPVTEETLAALPPATALRMARTARAALGAHPPARPDLQATVRERGMDEVEVAFATGDGRPALVVALRPGGGTAATRDFGVHVVSVGGDPTAARAALDWLWEGLLAVGQSPLFPPGSDALGPIDRGLAAKLEKLRRATAPGYLSWLASDVRPTEFELTFGGERGERVRVWSKRTRGRLEDGYTLERGDPSPELVSALGEIFVALGRLPAAPTGRTPPRGAIGSS